ncbi:hypothetical protein H9Y05_11445 [Crocinitomicaceae bacterium CZZ-1]|uniref:Uncharacterized protein n=1 Tax=Taishania pollutisoli TaxID=2766479 RepID=A0A8J6PR90_9FLAO|nr:hypothetical protein [Taishania pollutisoli]MBC9813083.1 hypothetical protein [Taishania pollutisoli]MBX2948829.1 hypothetical protein [Crocinitomicaceae bacterium]NGF75816.1 hypothetical protein [Fluviicola sp. SGL-29]
MKTLKVQIESLSEEWDIEVKQNNTTLHMIIICSKWKGRRSDPKTWAAQPLDDAFFPEMHKWIHHASEKPHQTKQITINDGTCFTINYVDATNAYQLIIRNFEAHTNEYLLVEKLLNFCVKQTHEDAQISSLNDRWKGSVQSI